MVCGCCYSGDAVCCQRCAPSRREYKLWPHALRVGGWVCGCVCVCVLCVCVCEDSPLPTPPSSLVAPRHTHTHHAHTTHTPRLTNIHPHTHTHAHTHAHTQVALGRPHPRRLLRPPISPRMTATSAATASGRRTTPPKRPATTCVTSRSPSRRRTPRTANSWTVRLPVGTRSRSTRMQTRTVPLTWSTIARHPAQSLWQRSCHRRRRLSCRHPRRLRNPLRQLPRSQRRGKLRRRASGSPRRSPTSPQCAAVLRATSATPHISDNRYLKLLKTQLEVTFGRPSLEVHLVEVRRSRS